MSVSDGEGKRESEQATAASIAAGDRADCKVRHRRPPAAQTRHRRPQEKAFSSPVVSDVDRLYGLTERVLGETLGESKARGLRKDLRVKASTPRIPDRSYGLWLACPGTYEMFSSTMQAVI